VQRGTVEALVKCGAFSSLEGIPFTTPAKSSTAPWRWDSKSQQDKRSGQMNIFGGQESPLAASQINHAPFAAKRRRIPQQRLAEIRKRTARFLPHQSPPDRTPGDFSNAISPPTTREALKHQRRHEVTLGGMLTRCDRKVAKSGRSAGKPWAILGIEDQEGKSRVCATAEVYADTMKRFPDVLTKDSIVFRARQGRSQARDPVPDRERIFPLTEAPAKLTTAVALKLDKARHTIESLREVAPLFKSTRATATCSCRWKQVRRRSS